MIINLRFFVVFNSFIRKINIFWDKISLNKPVWNLVKVVMRENIKKPVCIQGHRFGPFWSIPDPAQEDPDPAQEDPDPAPEDPDP